MAKAKPISSDDISQKIISEETSLIHFTEPFEVKQEDVQSSSRAGKSSSFKTHDPAAGGTCNTQEILDLICPPNEFEAGGKCWKQQVSAEPATRTDVQKLKENLNNMLKLRQARSGGICSVRLELFSQLFDELIRQVTVNCSERGLLLLRIRDELQLTISTHHALYESSIAFGSRKAAASEDGHSEYKEKIKEMEEENKEIEKEISQLSFKYKMMEIRAEEIREAQLKRHKNEAAFLQKTNQQLKDLRERLDYCYVESEEEEEEGDLENKEENGNENEIMNEEGTIGVDNSTEEVTEEPQNQAAVEEEEENNDNTTE